MEQWWAVRCTFKHSLKVKFKCTEAQGESKTTKEKKDSKRVELGDGKKTRGLESRKGDGLTR